MIKWFKMKRKETEVKLLAYTYILKFIEEKEEVINVAEEILEMVKGKTGNDFQQELVSQLALVMKDNAEKAKGEDDGE